MRAALPLLALSLLFAPWAARAELRPTDLRCEYRVDPIGIGEPHPRLGWTLATDDPQTRGQRQDAYHILVASRREILAADRGDRWDTGRVDSDRTNQIVYQGAPLAARMECWWKVRVWDGEGQASPWSPPARWTMGLLQPDDWQTTWIGYDAPAASPPPGDLELPPVPYLRRAFRIEKPVRRAVVYASALGLYQLSINGRRVERDIFTPGWTDYATRVYFNTYEVASLLQPGDNVLGALLADGWYAGYLGWGRKRNRYGGEPRLLVQLEIDYADGTSQVVASDGDWRASYGPLREADLLMGEVYDARLEMPGWDRPGFDDRDWQPVAVGGAIDVRLEAYPGIPVRATQDLPARSVAEPRPGVWVFDLEQNMVGWVRLRARGEAGRTITLRFAERLNPDGTIYTANLRDARATDSYTLKGEGEEVWEPRFTFHGFRYVELTGLARRPLLDDVTGVVVHSDLPRAGEFECSHPLVNQLYRNIVWGQRGNFLEVPTDCPQRDERLGWTGDAQVFIRTAAYNMDVAAFFTKWLVDLEDSQNAEGAYAHVAPDIGTGFGSPAWSDAGIICPYVIYRFYGDLRVVQRHWDSMARYLEYLRRNSEGLLRPAQGYGDWLALRADTPKEVIATAYFAYVAGLMEEMAWALGDGEGSEQYRQLRVQVRETFQRAFVAPDGRIKGDTQTGYLLALAMNLLPEGQREKALGHLLADLEERGWHLSTGFVGTPMLMPTLSRFGRDDVAYRLLANETFPSWLYPVRQGATTIWERWDGWTEERGFQDPGMNSFNHYAFGCVGEWLFETVAGLQPGAAGFRRFVIRPRPGGGLTHARAAYTSIHGEIVCGWRLLDGDLHLEISVPVNTTATVYLPTPDAGRVTEGGRPAHQAEGVERIDAQGHPVYRIGSGRYHFLVAGFEPVRAVGDHPASQGSQP